MSKRIYLALLIGLLILLSAFPAHAEGQAWIAVFGVDTGNFPKIRAWVEAWDSRGQFLSGIKAADVTVKEDGEPRAVLNWEERQPGAQVVIAVEPGRALGVRDELGVTRYEYIYHQVRSWADAPHAAFYDISLYTPDGPQVSHLADFGPFIQAWDAYQPDTTTTAIGLKALAEGLQLAADPTPQPGMGRALLWITPLPDKQALASLPQYLSLAQKARVRVYIWLVGPPNLAETSEGKQLNDFAQATLGRMTVFSGEETLPVLQDLFLPLTYIYQLTYASQAIQGDTHTLEVSLRAPGGETLQAEPTTFHFGLQPPEPIFLDPPQQIVRTLPAGATDPAERQPQEQTLRVGVSFPDGHTRDLTRLTLLVDGEVAAVRDMPPYDAITWDLTPYTQSGPHILQLEAEDIYGLVGRSQTISVQITIPKAQGGLGGTLAAHRQALTLGVVGLAGLVLLAVLFLGNRRQPAAAKAQENPAGAATRVKTKSSGSFRWPSWMSRRRGATPTADTNAALAYLVPLATPDDKAPTLPVLKIYTSETTIGSDPAQANLVIEDPTVDPLHARLWRTDEGTFFIADQHSTAGTWLNYAPVSPEGARLQEGDLIHLGRAGFRFRLHPEEPLRVVIKALEP